MSKPVERLLNGPDFRFLDNPRLTGEFNAIPGQPKEGTVKGFSRTARPTTYITPKERFEKTEFTYRCGNSDICDFAVFEPVLPLAGKIRPRAFLSWDQVEKTFMIAVDLSGQEQTINGSEIVSGIYDHKGQLTKLECRVGYIPRRENSSPTGEGYEMYSGPYWFKPTIRMPSLTKNGGKTLFNDKWVSFGTLLNIDRLDGNSMRVQKKGSLILVESGHFDSLLSQPDIAAAIPAHLDSNRVKALLISHDPKSVLGLSDIFQVAFASKEHNVSFNMVKKPLGKPSR